MKDAIFSQLDFGPISEFLSDDNVTDVSYSNNGQIWLKTLDKGIYSVERPAINNELMEKLAFQCSNCMGVTFNMAHPFLDAEGAELRLNFVHESIATNGIACVIRKTPAKIRLNKDKLLTEKYVDEKLHDFLISCVKAHCNIIVSGETGSGKTELVKYLASNTEENEKMITIEDTLELHLDRIFPHRDIVAMKTNNIASYSDVLVTCMRQNPKWILLSEVRSAEAVTAVRNSISSGHNIISTIHSDRAAHIPMRLYSLLEGSQDIDQFLKSIHRYVQIGIHVKGYMSAELQRFQREIVEVCEFYVDDNNVAGTNVLFHKGLDGTITFKNPTKNLVNYFGAQGKSLDPHIFGDDLPSGDEVKDEETLVSEDAPVNNPVENASAPVPGANPAPAPVQTETQVAPAQSAPVAPVTAQSAPAVTQAPATVQVVQQAPAEQQVQMPAVTSVAPVQAVQQAPASVPTPAAVPNTQVVTNTNNGVDTL